MNTAAFKNLYARASKYALAHKVISAAAIVVLVGGGWWAYSRATSASAETRYVLGSAQMGTIVASVSGSGQVAASSEVDVSGASSGKLIAVNVKAGQEVKAGALLAQVDPTDALYDLGTAQLSYDRLVTVDPEDLQDAKDSVVSAYADARASLSKASSDMHTVLDGLHDLFSGYLSLSNNSGVSATGRGYVSTAEKSYYASDDLLKAYDATLRSVSTASSQSDIENALSQAYDAALSAAQSAKSAQDAVVYLRTHNSIATAADADAAYSSVTSLASTANNAVSNTSSSRSSAIKSRQALADLESGPDALDLRSEMLSLQQKKDALADTYVRAPFDGIVSKVNVSVGDTVGSGTAIATVISKTQVATLSLNEVDAAKVQVGNKATLTFDAIDGLTLTGTVASIDAAGTVSQGVVSYALEIAFDAQDPRIKAGMTVNASIQTSVKSDVLIVPSSAVKTVGGASYVQVFDPPLAETGGAAGVASKTAPRQVAVETGLSDDTNVEIVSGLSEGEQVVTRTISATAATAATAATGANRGGFGGATLRAF
ncbi:MAG TPA: efflux RND transporter periplasmic adaptor subunit [Candidatus Paceibacterota bacterium]|nr:efflux RND transporter periplasmic adaptor subunit [Candidatus Paceibacterota bacterium]